jgi:hypothetical protein
MTLTDRDRNALTRSIALYRAASPTQRRQIDKQIENRDDRDEVARYCAFHMQVENLHLSPWQPAPCNVHVPSALVATDDEPRRGQRAAAMLRLRMDRLGVSKYEPDPAAALAEAERRTVPTK